MVDAFIELLIITFAVAALILAAWFFRCAWDAHKEMRR